MLATTSLLGVASLFLIWAYCIESLNHFIPFNGYAANGAFQLMNPLTRLADGQVLGRDFPFFHGAGVALIHFPLFVLFGEGLFGSEMSRWFTSLGLFCISTFLFIYLWFKTQRSTYIWPISIASFTLTLLITAHYAEVITPSNSLLGVRTTLPILIGALILFRKSLFVQKITLHKLNVPLYPLCSALLLALAVIMGTEHGIDAIVAYTLIEFVSAVVISLRSRRTQSLMRYIWLNLHSLLLTLASTAILLVILASIISLGHPGSLLGYALVTVPGDQFWYFGAEPQGYLKLHTLFTQLRDPSMNPLYIAILVSAPAIYLAKRLRLFSTDHWRSICFLVVYGLLTLSSLLGYFFPEAQIHGTLRVLILIDSLIAVHILFILWKKTSWLSTTVATIIALGMAVLCFNFANAKLAPYDIHQTARATYHNMRGDHSELLAPAWNERLNSFQPYINMAKKENPSYPLWSTYASLYERQNNLIHPSSSGCDYIIHCLGESRDQYTNDFIEDKPELVATIRPAYFGFEEWLWSRHSDFYTHLANNYDIVSENTSHILWKRSALPDQSTSPQDLKIDTATHNITLPTVTEAGSQVIEVTVNYRPDPLYSKLPLLNKLPRYILRPIGTISTIGFSLPPKEKAWKFIVVLDDTNKYHPYLNYYADGLLPHADLAIKKATYAAVPVTEQERNYFTERFVPAE